MRPGPSIQEAAVGQHLHHTALLPWTCYAKVGGSPWQWGRLPAISFSVFSHSRDTMHSSARCGSRNISSHSGTAGVFYPPLPRLAFLFLWEHDLVKDKKKKIKFLHLLVYSCWTQWPPSFCKIKAGVWGTFLTLSEAGLGGGCRQHSTWGRQDVRAINSHANQHLCNAAPVFHTFPVWRAAAAELDLKSLTKSFQQPTTKKKKEKHIHCKASEIFCANGQLY